MDKPYYEYSKGELRDKIARLQAEVERLTRERDEAREGWHVEMPNDHTAPLN